MLLWDLSYEGSDDEEAQTTILLVFSIQTPYISPRGEEPMQRGEIEAFAGCLLLIYKKRRATIVEMCVGDYSLGVMGWMEALRGIGCKMLQGQPMFTD